MRARSFAENPCVLDNCNAVFVARSGHDCSFTIKDVYQKKNPKDVVWFGEYTHIREYGGTWYDLKPTEVSQICAAPISYEVRYTPDNLPGVTVTKTVTIDQTFPSRVDHIHSWK